MYKHVGDKFICHAGFPFLLAQEHRLFFYYYSKLDAISVHIKYDENTKISISVHQFIFTTSEDLHSDGLCVY